MKGKNIVWLIAIVVVIIGLMIWGRTASKDVAGHWEDTQVLCLPAGHANLAYHIHPALKIFVDGEEEAVPANIGVSDNCMAEIHTHDGTGKIHIETTSAGREITLENFFEVWGQEIERGGYQAEITVNGEPVADPASFVPQDLDEIVVSYVSAEGESAEENATSTDDETVEGGASSTLELGL